LDYKVQLKNIESSITLENIPEDAIGFVLSSLVRENDEKIFIHIAKNRFICEILKKEIEFFNPEVKILVFENWDNLPYDKSSPKNVIQAERIKTLNEIANYFDNKKIIIITTIRAVLQRVMPKSILKKSFVKLEIGQSFSMEKLEDFLVNAGYKQVNTAISTGEFAINNNVVDVITEEERCYRVKFSNNIVKEIRKFNPISQVSFDNLKQVNLIPVNEIIFSKDYILNFKQNYKKLFGVPKKEDLLYEAVSNNQLYAGLENYLPLFYDNKLETIFDYLPKGTIITIDESVEDKKAKKLDLIEQHYKERVANIKSSLKNGSLYNPLPPRLLYLDDKEFNERLCGFVNVRFSDEGEIFDERKMDLGIKKGKDFYKESTEKKVNVFEELKNKTL